MKGRLRPIDYLGWAQTMPAGARWDLTRSGVLDTCADATSPAWDLQGGLDSSAACRRESRASVVAGFVEAVAARYGVDPECVVPTMGASGAILQVLFALARPGEHVLVERPTFEPLHRVPEMLGLSVSRLERRFEERWEALPDRLARLLTPKTRAVILSNLHNPTGVAIDATTLAAVGEMAARVGAMVLVDEVYLDFAFDPDQPVGTRPACTTLDNGVSWSSATKVLGFSALRVGWMVTRDREFAAACRSAAHYFHVDPPLAPLATVTAALAHADELAAAANAAIAAARVVIDGWLEEEQRVGWIPPAAGQTGLLRLPALTSDQRFTQHLRDHYGTQVVPGSMFEAPGTVRVSFNLPAEELSAALSTISAALDDFEQGRAAEA